MLFELCENGTGSECPARLVLRERVGDGIEKPGDFLDAVAEKPPVVVHGQKPSDVQVVHVEGAPTLRDVVGYDLPDATGRAHPNGAHGSGDEVVAHLTI